MMVRTALLAVLGQTLVLTAPSEAATGQPQGCGFGTAGPSASTICWLDMSGLDQALARTPAGQPMTVRLTDAYSISFRVRISPGADGSRDLSAVPFPTYAETPIGNTAYVGTPGSPALYQELGAAGGDQGTVSLKDIVVTGPDGAPLDGYGLVVADAETTHRDEALEFFSDKPLQQLAQVVPPGYARPCEGGLAGLGSTAVRCVGAGAGPHGDLVAYALAPSRMTAHFVNRNPRTRQGVAFGVLVSKVALTKHVAGRVDSDDSFAVRIRDNAGNVVASAATGTASKAATGSHSVLAGLPYLPYVFEEAPGAGTNLADYTVKWACTDRGKPVRATGDDRSRTVPVTVGADVHCVVTNSAPAPRVKVSKSVNTTVARPGQKVTYTFRVANIGKSVATGISAVDRLADRLRLARYNDDAHANTGTVTRTGEQLVWQGALQPGQVAVVTYSMTVRRPLPAGGPHRLRNLVTVTAPGSNCVAGSADQRCRDTTTTKTFRAGKGVKGVK
ncbi:CshA/CshB family fibrillar adhesin-related protein [Nonomuraea sp. NPDC050310]|uniref:CshA/CshB family fibrillar adhesin-related protein n=1 Tax=Nonomuraea sp. NPDC050310 TaxID=3154935 RepID=UPI0033EFE1F8